MKRLIWLLFLALGICSACQKGGVRDSNDPWDAYRKAYELLRVNRDSAFLHFNQLAENSKDRQQVALAYYNMALIQTDAGDHYGAQESLTASLGALDENLVQDRGYLVNDFNELAMTSYNLQDYTGSLNSAQKALSLLPDTTLLPYILTNQGNAYLKLKLYDQAISSYRKVIKLSGQQGIIFAKALTSLRQPDG